MKVLCNWSHGTTLIHASFKPDSRYNSGSEAVIKLKPTDYQLLISPCNTNNLPRQVTTIKNILFSWCTAKFSELKIKGNLWKSVGRIHLSNIKPLVSSDWLTTLSDPGKCINNMSFYRFSVVMRQWKTTSSVNAPASLKSSLVSTQYILCGQERDEGRGRGIVVLKMYSRPVGGGKSWNGGAGRRCGERKSESEEITWEKQASVKIVARYW